MERAFVKASRSRKKFMICHFGTRQMRWSRKLMTFGPLLMNRSVSDIYVYVAVKFLSQVIFIFLLFLGMVMYGNEVETKEK